MIDWLSNALRITCERRGHVLPRRSGEPGDALVGQRSHLCPELSGIDREPGRLRHEAEVPPGLKGARVEAPGGELKLARVGLLDLGGDGLEQPASDAPATRLGADAELVDLPPGAGVAEHVLVALLDEDGDVAGQLGGAHSDPGSH